MKRFVRGLGLAIVVLLFLVFLFHRTLLTAAGSFLVRAESPEQADIALVLAGDTFGNRILKAAELVREGYVPKALISGPSGIYGLYECDLAIPFAVKRGYPESYFLHFENGSRSTLEEGRDAVPVLEKLGVHKALVITSNYHTRRAGDVYRGLKTNSGIQFVMIAARDENFTADGWWHSREGRKTALYEWMKNRRGVAAPLGVGSMLRTLQNRARILRVMKQALYAVAVSALTLSFAALAQDAPAPDLMNPATLDLQAPADYTVKIKTTKGDVLIYVKRSWAPNGADRFYNLVRAGFYTDSSFFRVMLRPSPFMVQFGISAKPEVSKIWGIRGMKDDPVKESNTKGMVSFANISGVKDSRTTMIFINMVDNSDTLNSQGFAPFGEVTKGLELMNRLYDGYGPNAETMQVHILTEGNAYLEKNFPKLDKVLEATIDSSSDSKKKK